jgi:hypothetical protein
MQHQLVTQGTAMRNIPYVRWDADPVYASPDYLPQVLDVWRQDDAPNKCAYPVVQHDRLDPEKFPNINRLLDWYDLNLKLRKSIVSAHFAVDMLGYAASGGLPGDCAVSEVQDITNRMDATEGLPPFRLYHLGKVVVRVSCRRIAKRSATEGYPVYDELYMPSDDHPTHRNEPPARDISELEYRHQGGWRIYNVVQYYGDQEYYREIQAGVRPERAQVIAAERMRMFGELTLQEFGDPPAMQRVLDGAVASWPLTGPPAGKPQRKLSMMNLRNMIPDRSAGGSGILYNLDDLRS